MKTDNYIKVYDNIISPNHCNKIIEIFEQNAQYHESHDTEGYKFTQLNLRSNRVLSNLENAFLGTLVPIYHDYFEQTGMKKFVEFGRYEEIRIKKYIKGSGDEFKEHVDVVNHDTARRFCIAILYLNDNDGFTEFPNSGIIVEPKAGRVVVFPPFWMFPHRGASPTDSDKYIMMSCMHYI